MGWWIWVGLSSEVNVLSLEDLCTFTEAMAPPDALKWLATCNEELTSIKELSIFKLVPKSAADGHSLMDGRFIFKVKHDEKGHAVCWKARYMVQGYAAIYDIDYTETMASMMWMETFRAIAHIAVVCGWILHQFDIITAFLCRKLEPGEEVYVKQPKGFEESGLEEYNRKACMAFHRDCMSGTKPWTRECLTSVLGGSFVNITYTSGIQNQALSLWVSMLMIFCCGLQPLANVYLQGWIISYMGNKGSHGGVGVTIECDLANNYI